MEFTQCPFSSLCSSDLNRDKFATYLHASHVSPAKMPLLQISGALGVNTLCYIYHRMCPFPELF